MSLRISVREVEGVSVLDLDGAIVRGDECESFGNQIEALLEADKEKLLINMEHVSRMDGAGLGVLIRCIVLTQEKGGQLRLMKTYRRTPEPTPFPPLKQFLDEKIGRIYDNETEAISSFR